MGDDKLGDLTDYKQSPPTTGSLAKTTEGRVTRPVTL